MPKAEQKSRILPMPGRTFFIFSLMYLLLGCFAFFFNRILLIWLLTGAAAIPFIITDLLLLLLLGDRLKTEREIPSALAQNRSVPVKLIISRNKGMILSGSVRLCDLYPESMRESSLNETNVFPAKILQKKSGRKNFKKLNHLVFEYSLLPEKRGPWFFIGTEFMMTSPLCFWNLRVTHDTVSEGRTYPDFKNLARGVHLNGNPEKGETKQIRRRGQGMEFENLRDYQEGDSTKSIDWQATSRNRTLDGKIKLIVRNYQEEQDQQILLIIDSGYRLQEHQFDSALEAMLLLSYTALKHGDAAGAASFGASDIWIPPQKGMRAYNNLMNSLYDLHSAPVPSSPFKAMETALNHLHRRSFIILISNFREEDGESLSWILPRVNQRHLLLMVSFHESSIYELAQLKLHSAERNISPPREKKSDEEILNSAAAYSYLANHRRLYRKWEHSGLLVLETSPEQITSALINKYLSVKKSCKL